MEIKGMEVRGTPVSMLDKKNQVTIPKAIREQLELEVGDYILFYNDNYNTVVMSKATVIVQEK